MEVGQSFRCVDTVTAIRHHVDNLSTSGADSTKSVLACGVSRYCLHDTACLAL